jgi:osmoprotectant transport system permease protein
VNVVDVVAQGPVIPDFGNGSGCRANETFCWDWFADHWDRFATELVQHVYVSAIAIVIGLVVALPAALLAYRLPRFETPAVVFSTVLYTIPVLGFFLLMIPVTGIGLLTIEIALVGYTLLLLFRNTLTGLRSVPPEVRAAALGMGLTPGQILVRITFPLALPAVMAGLRVVTVTTISLATLAAYIAPYGLGQSILFYIGNTFISGLISAGVLAILLALVADALIVGLTTLVTPWARARRGGA